MQRIVERPPSLHVHKESVTACVLLWQRRELQEHIAQFKTTVQPLFPLRHSLQSLPLKQLAIQATLVYSPPLCAILQHPFALMLVNAPHVKAVPARKTDFKHAQWLSRRWRRRC